MMENDWEVDALDIDRIYTQLKQDARRAGYYLNPDEDFTRELVKGLIVNGNRYGYFACPCRLAVGEREYDRDIICPCVYRDDDLVEFGSCYCALYVSRDVAEGRREVEPIPERRPPEVEQLNAQAAERPRTSEPRGLAYPVWRCSVCGYLCARDTAPDVCPICKADRDRFELFMRGG